jgi:hypothetical protein
LETFWKRCRKGGKGAGGGDFGDWWNVVVFIERTGMVLEGEVKKQERVGME